MLRLSGIARMALAIILDRYSLDLRLVSPGEVIPGSYWGEAEAGLLGRSLYARLDTPVHSVLHEAAHYACMSPERRAGLNTDAGGDFFEENAVCYLQILLSMQLPEMGWQRMCRDMDRWGYTFRLKSAAAWFERDAADAATWLKEHGLIDRDCRPTLRCR